VDLQKAIRAHQQWVSILTRYNEGDTDASLDPSVIAQDTKCELGKMLDELPPEVRKLPAFTQLKREHVTLHSVAAQLILRIAGGERLPESELGMGSAFARLSHNVVFGLKTLWRAMEDANLTGGARAHS
jgi:hypothetical protein